MSRKRRQNDQRSGELNLTAMIDVAFQLLAFFVISTHPVDVIGHLDVAAPSVPPSRGGVADAPPLLRITVAGQEYLLNDVPMAVADLRRVLVGQGQGDPGQTVLIQCDQAARHERLVSALELCAESRLSNIVIVTANRTASPGAREAKDASRPPLALDRSPLHPFENSQSAAEYLKKPWLGFV